MFRAEIPLRWGDLDAQGHVNNARFLQLLQEARVRLLHARGLGSLLRDGVVVTEHQVEYLAPVGFSVEPLVAELAVTKVGASAFTLAYSLSHDGALAVRAQTSCCALDVRAEIPEPRRLTADERSELVGLAAAVEPLADLPYAPVGERGQETLVAPRWSDEDRYEHVNNAIYYDYLQEARIATMGAADASTIRTGAGEAAHMWLIARQDVRYRAPMFYRGTRDGGVEPFAVRTAVARFGNSSLTLAGEIVEPRSGTVCASAMTVLVCAGVDGVPRPLPETIRESLAPYAL